jgi:ribosomal protein L7/L12
MEPLSQTQQALADLKLRGVSPIEAIKHLHEAFGLSLAEAKLELSRSPSWEPEVKAADSLHSALVGAIPREHRS